MKPRRIRLEIGAVLLLLFFLAAHFVAGCGTSAALSWPQPGADPIPPERIPESIPPGAAAQSDSMRLAFDAIFAGRDLPSPPDRPAPRLVAWIVAILMYPQPGEVEAFGDSARPEEWSAADSGGALPLAAALALHEIGRDAQALAWCDRDRAVATEDRPYLDLLEIELRAALGDSAGLTQASERVVSGGHRNDPVFRGVASRVLDAHEKDPASLLRESLRIRRDLGSGPEESAARYRALVALGLPAASVGDTLMRLYPEIRSARVEALRRLREKGRRITRAERNVLFDVLVRQSLFGEADTLLQRVPSDSLRIVRLERLLAARQYDLIFADRTVRSQAWSRALLSRWHLVRGRAARNAGRTREMERHYAAAASLGGETRTAALSEWAREAESDARNRQADSLYTLLMRDPRGADDARFRRGIARYASGRLAAAEADFALLRTGPLSSAGAFWLGRIAQTRGDTAAARAALLHAARDGGSYYGRRARTEAAHLAEGGKPGAFWNDEREILFRPRADRIADSGALACPPAGKIRVRADRIRLLRRFARAEWAEREENLLVVAMPADRRMDRFFCLGLPDLAVRVAVGGGSGALSTYRYPRPYAVWILDLARRRGIAPELVWAIARRESLFDAGAVSTAGARGLLQLMDETAMETARKWQMPPGPLERGDRNLDLGMCHLQDLRREHDWPVPAFLAAYNAGASKTGEWVDRSPDPDLFVERIGWRETRDYVKNVLEACWIYRDALEGKTE